MSLAIERVMAPPFGPDDEAYREHLVRYEFALPFVKDLKVLDIACGTGFGSEILARAAKSVLGIDNSSDALKFAREHYHARNLDFQIADAANIPLADQSFDAVVSFETIEHLPDQDKFLGEIKRVLKDDGLLIVSTPDREIIPKFFLNPEQYHNPFHIKELSWSEFETMLKNYFSRVDFYGQGLYHDRGGANTRKLLSSFKRRFGHFIPRGFKKMIKAGLLGAGDSGAITRLEPGSRAKFLIAVARP